MEALKNWPLVGITPTALRRGNVGSSSISRAMCPRTASGSRWKVPEHVRFIEMKKIDAGVRPSGERLHVEQPVFTSLKDTVTFQVRSGQRVLLGVHMIPREDGAMELFLLRVRTERSGAAK